MNHGGVLVGGKGVLVVGGFGDTGGGKWRVLRSAEFLPFEGLPTMAPAPKR